MVMFIHTNFHLTYSSYLSVTGYFKEFTILVEFNNGLVGYFLNKFILVKIQLISFKALKYIQKLINTYKHINQ